MKENIAIGIAILALVFGFFAWVGDDNQSNVGGTRFPSGLSADGTEPTAGQVRGTTLNVTGASTLTGAVSMASTLAALALTEVITADNTITASESGSTFFLSTNTSTSTLPTATAGATFRFQIGAAIGAGNAHIDSAEGDNISGTLSVNNADVDCVDEDQIQFITDGETIGDYVTLISDGTSWFITGSDAATAAKITCTDPT